MPEVAQPQQLNIVRPPEFVYRFRQIGGSDINRMAPAREVIQKQQGVFEFVGVKYPSMYHKPDEFYAENGLQRDWFKYPLSFASQGTQTQIWVHSDQPPLTEAEEKMGGQLTCFSGVPYPYKGHPSPEPIYAINVSKRLTRVVIESFFHKDLALPFLAFALISRKKKLQVIERLISGYCFSCVSSAQPYILGFEFMTKYGQEIEKFCSRLLTKFGVNEEIAKQFGMCFASQIDYDNAYWMKLGDAMAETTKEKMLENPRRELLKLAEVIKAREFAEANAERFGKAIKAISFLLYIPRYKRIFREAIQESAFENFQFDDADRYHTLVYSDYRYQGKSLDERMKIWEDYHRDTNTPLPKRMTITS